jgi:hypothetical protein
VPATFPIASIFDLADGKPLPPSLFITEAEHDPFRIRYRLVGTRAVEATRAWTSSAAVSTR